MSEESPLDVLLPWYVDLDNQDKVGNKCVIGLLCAKLPNGSKDLHIVEFWLSICSNII